MQPGLAAYCAAACAATSRQGSSSANLVGAQCLRLSGAFCLLWYQCPSQCCYHSSLWTPTAAAGRKHSFCAPAVVAHSNPLQSQTAQQQVDQHTGSAVATVCWLVYCLLAQRQQHGRLQLAHEHTSPRAAYARALPLTTTAHTVPAALLCRFCAGGMAPQVMSNRACARFQS